MDVFVGKASARKTKNFLQSRLDKFQIRKSTLCNFFVDFPLKMDRFVLLLFSMKVEESILL